VGTAWDASPGLVETGHMATVRHNGAGSPCVGEATNLNNNSEMHVRTKFLPTKSFVGLVKHGNSSFQVCK
jgi:hypothetical protein